VSTNDLQRRERIVTHTHTHTHTHTLPCQGRGDRPQHTLLFFRHKQVRFPIFDVFAISVTRLHFPAAPIIPALSNREFVPIL
jgi:hypothetical protein